MGSVELYLSVVFAITVTFAGGLTLSGTTPVEFFAARILFGVAATSLSFGYLAWLRQHRQKPATALAPEILMGLIVALLVFIGAPLMFYWVKIKETAVINDNESSFVMTHYIFEKSADSPTYSLNIFTMNKGKISGDKPTINWRLVTSRIPLPDSETDVQMDAVLTNSIDSLPIRQNATQIEPNVEGRVTVTTDLTEDEHYQVGMSHRVAYLFLVLVWSDRTLSNDWWWVREVCVFQQGEFENYHLCNKHNYAYKKYIKKT